MKGADFAYCAGTNGPEVIYEVSLTSGNVRNIPFETQNSRIDAITYLGETFKLAAIVGERELVVFDLNGKRLAASPIYPNPGKRNGRVGGFAASSDGKFVAITSSNEVVKAGISKPASPCQLTIFNNEAVETLTWQFEDIQDFLNAQPVFSNAETLVLCLPTGKLLKWDLQADGKTWKPSEKQVRIPPGRFLAAAPGKSGHTIWLAEDREIVMRNIDSGEVVASAHIDPGQHLGDYYSTPIMGIAPIPNTDLIAAAMWDGRVAVAKPYIEPQ